jgi:hypothetical protein
MKRTCCIALVLLVLVVCACAFAAPPDTVDVRTFEIRPLAPPSPALKYRLLFDPVEQFHGNAALALMQATMFVEPEIDKLRETCLDDLNNKDEKAFHEHATQLVAQCGKIFDELDVACRRENCDWEPPIRQRGIMALLPHLQRMRQLSHLIRIRATLELRDGKAEDALVTLRLGYELARKTGTEPVLVSGLVALGIENEMNVTLAELSNRPECPNLYWALARMPRRLVSFSRNMQGEHAFMGAALPAIERVRAGETLTADDYRELMRQTVIVLAPMGPDWKRSTTGPTDQEISDSFMASVPAAQAHWAESRQVPLEQVRKLDPFHVVMRYWWEQYEALADEQYKLVELPYPLMLEKMQDLRARLQQTRRDEPVNPFRAFISALDKAAVRYARVERQEAALMAVEAIRSHATANGGKLPDKLEEIGETPVLPNPLTGLAFEYRKEGDAAVISDSSAAEFPLQYTVKLRK